MNEEEIREAEAAGDIVLATVDDVGEDGITLIFDGTEEASEKAYKCNNAVIFEAGDRVKICQDSGTYIVEYVVGTPGDRYPLPAGGTEGQVLAKSSGDDYAVAWTTPTTVHGIPAGGSSGQVLTKSSGTDYAVSWATPSTSHGIPSGGSAGQVLAKSSATDYAVSWTTPTVAQMSSGNYSVQLSSNVLRPGGTGSYGVSLGSSSYPFVNLYASGTISLGSAVSSSLGFFGHTPASRQTVSNTATVATLITALKAYGLIN